MKKLPVTCFTHGEWVVASCSAKGIRGAMEDVTVTDSVLAVLDGHGGCECADFIASQLPPLAQLTPMEWNAAFAKLDDAFRSRNMPSGSTCVLAVADGCTLNVANLGDSRAVLCRKGQVVGETVDHKPSATSERDRIQNCGGRVVEDGIGPARVEGVAVSRAFGTYESPLGKKILKDPHVPHKDRIISCIPELFSWSVEPGDVLVLGCDGVWDEIEARDVASIEGDVRERALLICERALQSSTDNVSCLVAEFGGSLPQRPDDVSQEDQDPAVRHPSFNCASNGDQLDIGQLLGYGETIIELMHGLETDNILDGLWLGQVGDSCYRPFLKFAKITRVLNCAAEVDRPDLTDSGINTFDLRWRDSEEQGKVEQKNMFRRLQAATAFIHQELEAEQVVLVHCVQGVSRSASVVVAYLMEWQGMSMDDAVVLVRQRHPVALKPFRLQELLRAFHYFLQSQRPTTRPNLTPDG